MLSCLPFYSQKETLALLPSRLPSREGGTDGMCSPPSPSVFVRADSGGWSCYWPFVCWVLSQLILHCNTKACAGEQPQCRSRDGRCKPVVGIPTRKRGGASSSSLIYLHESMMMIVVRRRKKKSVFLYVCMCTAACVRWVIYT